MTPDLSQLQARREQILHEMGTIDRICRGSLSRQMFKARRGGKPIRRGPYYILQRWFSGKNLCERVSAEQLEPVRQGVEGYKRFRQLADEFVEVSEQITVQSGALPAIKKKRAWPSPKNASRKPPVS